MRGFASLKAFFALRPTNPYLFWTQVGEWAISVALCFFFPSYFTFFFWRELLRHVLHTFIYFVFFGSKQHRTAKFLYLGCLQCEEFWPVFKLRFEPNATYREYKETAHMLCSSYPIS